MREKNDFKSKMTSTNFNIGFGEQRNSSKVLKPPGGGSSDIFGAAANGSSGGSATPRSASKNHMASNIFAAPQSKNGDARRYTNADSHNRLFGEVERPVGPVKKSNSKSNIPFGGGDATDAPPTANGNGSAKAAHNGNGVASIVHAENGNNGHHHQQQNHASNGNGLNNGDLHHASSNGSNGNGKHDGGNPITGQGSAQNGARPVINKNRIPPGGFSSGLW